MAGTMGGMSLSGTRPGTSSYQTSVTGGVKLAGGTGVASYTSAASRVASSAGPSTTTRGSVTASQASGTWPAQFKKTTPASGWATQGPSSAAGASRRGASLGAGEQSSGNGKFAKVRAVSSLRSSDCLTCIARRVVLTCVRHRASSR